MTYYFDKKGNLFLYELISVNELSEFEQFFVTAVPSSTTRDPIYSGLLNYLYNLSEILRQLNYTGQWEIWLNGSFTTGKINPLNLDILNLLTDDTILRNSKIRFEPFFAHNARNAYDVDAYFLLENE